MSRCCSCGEEIKYRSEGADYCQPCLGWADRLRRRAYSDVQKAIKRGELKPAIYHRCADCGLHTAAHYDHRYYSRPLLVVPVCNGCNGRRGPPLDIGALIKARRAGMSVDEARKLVSANIDNK